MSYVFGDGSSNEVEEKTKLQSEFNIFCKHLFYLQIILYVILGGIVISIASLVLNKRYFAISIEQLPKLIQLVLFCFILLLINISIKSIRTNRKPFTRCLSNCTLVIGSVLVFFSAMIPVIMYLNTNHGFNLDYISLILGFAIILLSRILHFGINLQISDELTI